MVHTEEGPSGRAFVCDECGFGYTDEATAQSCEAYCAEHGACSLEITAKAVSHPDGDA